MHDSWRSFVSGWQRIYAEAARRRVRRLRRSALQVGLFGAVMPAAAGAGIGAALVWSGHVPPPIEVAAFSLGLAALLIQVATIGLAFRLGGVPWRSVAAYPVGAALVSVVLCRTARMVSRREATRWGGREYRFAPR